MKDLLSAAKKVQTWIHAHPRKATIVRSVIDEFDNAIEAFESDPPTVAKLSTVELRKELKAFNDWMCGNQYDGRIPLIDTCIDEYLASRPDSKAVTDANIESYFDKWIIKHVGIQDADIFSKGSLVRQVAIDYAKAMRDNKIK